MLEHSPAEIAAVLGIEANAVRVHLHHARTKLRALLRSELITSLACYLLSVPVGIRLAGSATGRWPPGPQRALTLTG